MTTTTAEYTIVEPLEATVLRRLLREYFETCYAGNLTAAAIAAQYGDRVQLTRAAINLGEGFVEVSQAGGNIVRLISDFVRHLPADVYALVSDPKTALPITLEALAEALASGDPIPSVFVRILNGPAPELLASLVARPIQPAAPVDNSPRPYATLPGKPFSLENAMLRILRHFSTAVLGSTTVEQMMHDGQRARVRRTARTQELGPNYVDLSVHIRDTTVHDRLFSLIDSLAAFVATDEAGAPFAGVTPELDRRSLGSWFHQTVCLVVRPIIETPAAEASAPAAAKNTTASAAVVDDRPAIERMTTAEWRSANIGSW